MVPILFLRQRVIIARLSCLVEDSMYTTCHWRERFRIANSPLFNYACDFFPFSPLSIQRSCFDKHPIVYHEALYTAPYCTRGAVGDRNNSAARVQKINHYIYYIKRLGRVSLPRGGIETIGDARARTRKTLIFPTCVSHFYTRIYIYVYTRHECLCTGFAKSNWIQLPMGGRKRTTER